MASTQDDALTVGSIFAGRYRIRRFLGEGDRKRTYLVDDTVFPRRVALALIKPEAALSDPEGTRREAEALAKAGTNENIVTLHDSGTIEGTEYLVFDYLSGGTLREYMSKRAERNKPMSVEEVMHLGRRLARALAHVHGLGMIHRDVAPGNVWLDERQLAHLGDFDGLVSELLVAERLNRRLEGADLRDERLEPLDFSFVLGADDLREQLADHAYEESGLRRNIYRL